MNEDPANDDAVGDMASSNEPDPFGHASLVVVESLIHGLIAKGAISVADAVEIVEVASDVKTELGAELGDSPRDHAQIANAHKMHQRQSSI